MTEIQYVIGDATDPIGDGPKILVHCCNDLGAWGAGFTGALSEIWSAPERAYREWHDEQIPPEGSPFLLGRAQIVLVDPDLWVANIIGQKGIGRKNGPPIRYWAITEGLGRVAEFALVNNASIHMPRMGAGLAGGAWEKIEDIIKATLCARSLDVFVYDLP